MRYRSTSKGWRTNSRPTRPPEIETPCITIWPPFMSLFAGGITTAKRLPTLVVRCGYVATNQPQGSLSPLLRSFNAPPAWILRRGASGAGFFATRRNLILAHHSQRSSRVGEGSIDARRGSLVASGEDQRYRRNKLAFLLANIPPKPNCK